MIWRRWRTGSAFSDQWSKWHLESSDSPRYTQCGYEIQPLRERDRLEGILQLADATPIHACVLCRRFVERAPTLIRPDYAPDTSAPVPPTTLKLLGARRPIIAHARLSRHPR